MAAQPIANRERNLISADRARASAVPSATPIRVRSSLTALASLSPIVRGGSEVGDELDASFPEIAVEPVLAGIGRSSGWQAWRRLPFALGKEKWSISVTRRRSRDAGTLLLCE
jgi:hypothetical protein